MSSDLDPSVRADDAPTLTHAAVAAPRALVLMLHGGAAHGTEPVDESSLSWRRSHHMMRSVRRPLNDEDVSVSLLRYRVKGWNAEQGTPAPVRDARWALDLLHAEHPGVPIVLLGHSMGGRTAVSVADHPAVSGVVALAPWLAGQDPVGPLRGKTLRAAHGRRDKITSARATAAYVERARAAGADARFLDMGPVGHYMFRRAGAWNRTAVEQTLDLLA